MNRLLRRSLPASASALFPLQFPQRGMGLVCLLLLATVGSAQVTLISGYNFGQFLGSGFPAMDGTTGDAVGSIGSNFRIDTKAPNTSSGDYVGNNSLAGNYSNGFGRIYWDGTNGSSSYNLTGGVQITATNVGPNSVNSGTVQGYSLAQQGDGGNLALTTNVPNNKLAFVQNTSGFLDFNPADYTKGALVTSNANLTFAASVTAPTTISWFLGSSGTAFATTNLSGSAMTAYAVDLPADFYNKTSATLVAQFGGTATIDNVQFNGISASSVPVGAPFWKGGDGTWSTATTPTNWRDAGGTTQAAWTTGAATFRGTAGTVTVDNTAGQVVFTGATFSTTGYTIAGGALKTDTAVTPIQVGDATADTATMNATISAPIIGTGGISKTGLGTLTLSGNGTYTGNTTVSAGTLLINGDQSGATGPVSVASLASLGGTGTTGNVTVQNGAALVGKAGSVLTLTSLNLNATSQVNVTLGAPATTGLFKVNGALTLDGVLNVTGATGFGAGLYRIFDFTGALTNNIITVGSKPAAVTGAEVQTSVANQVNVVFSLASNNTTGNNSTGNSTGGNMTGGNTTGGNTTGGNTTPPPANVVGARPMWTGGTGTWTVSTNATNWKSVDGTQSGAWQPGFAIFQGSPGTVTVDNAAGALVFSGLQAASDGYTITGGSLTTNTARTSLRVGDGTSAGSNMTATVSAAITGTGSIEKTDLGTAVLTGENTYSGGTTISSGKLQIGAGGNSGSVTGNITNNAELVLNRSDAVTIAGSIRGTGVITHAGSGTTSLTGNNSASGGVTISAGTLQIGAGGTTGSLTGNIVNNAALSFNRTDTLTVPGAISGSGTVTQAGTGTTSLTGAATHTGGTTITAGTLQIGAGGTTGSLTGNVVNNAALSFNRSDALTFDGVISGTGGVAQQGAGTTTLTANHTYSGGTTVNAGTLLINGNQSGATGAVVVAAGGRLGGTGATGGVVTVQNNGALAAAAGSVFTVGGLTLSPAAQLNLSVGAPSTTALLQVNGGLTLDGAYNLGDAGGLVPGVYRIANYTGTLVNNTLQFGSAPVNPGDLAISTATANQVNLTFVATVSDYWTGGNGTWTAANNTTTWKNVAGAAAGAWQSRTATFGGTAGTVTVDNTAGAVNFTGAQFLTSGYTVAGGSLTTTAPDAVIQVGTGGAAGANHTATIAAVITGTGGINKTDLGTLTLSGNNTYTGNTTVTAGTLVVSGNQTAASGAVTVGAGARLAGTGALAAVTIQNGGTLFGSSGSTLTMAGLTLSPNARVSAALGAPTTTGLFQVNGSLTLDGQLDLTSTGTFGPGLYRLFNYTGSLVDNGLLIGSTPAGALVPTVQTSVANQVNLLVAVAPLPIWTGGSGTWSASSTATNWGAAEGNYQGGWQPGMAIFQGAPGTVTVDTTGGPVVVTGLQFAVDGYTVTGGALTTNTATTVLRTGDGTFAGDSVTGTIAAPIIGTGGIDKTDLGTLVLSGNNTYSGGTTISGGTLQIGAGGTTGSIVGNVTNNATLKFNRSDSVTFAGVISGSGAVVQAGTGTTALTGNNTYSGGTEVTAGTLQIGAGGTAGSVTGNISNAGTVSFNRSDATTFAGVISGSGAVTHVGPGTTTLTGANTYTGGTTVTSGVLQLGAGGTTGSITGNVVNQATVVFNRSDAVTVAGVISGSGNIVQQGSGTTVLTGANSYTGGTTINAGTLQIGAGGTTGSLAGNVVNNATLTINRSDAVTLGGGITGSGSLVNAGAGNTTFSGVIGGTGSFRQEGTGTVIFNATNTYTGGTTIAAGTLQIGSGGTTGSVGGNIVNNATLAINRSDAVTLAGVVSGSGALVQLGNGTTTLAGANTYTGGTTITAGTLQIGAGGATGSLVGNVLNNGTLAVNRSDAVTVDGVISGSGALKQVGSGTTILTGANTYAGGTTINAGTLQLGSGGSAGSVTGNIVNNATLTLNRGDANTVESVISGTGSLRQLGSGTTTLTGANLYTGGTTISAGTLQIGSGGTAGSLTGNVVNNGTLAINRSDAYTMNGTVSGTGVLVQAGTGTTTLVAANTYAGGTTINAGTLQLGSGGTTGSVTGNIVNHGTLALNRSDAVVITNPISGSGVVAKLGGGQVTLAGNNTYSGGTTVNAGVLEVSDNTNLGAPSGAVTLNGGTLRAAAGFTLARSLALESGGGTIDTGANILVTQGAISGSGNLTKTGTGELRIAALTTYTGTTTITQGAIVLNGGSLSTAAIAAGARLTGNGSIRGNLTNAGLLSPGASAGTISVAGNFTQSATGSYVAELGSPTSFDSLVVSGTATLGGTLTVTGLNGYVPNPGQTFRVVEAAAISGKFATLVSPWEKISPMLRFEALYSSKDVRLSMTQLPFAGLTGTPNQIAMGQGVDGAIALGSIPNLQRALNALPNTDRVKDALSELSPLRYDRWFQQAVLSSGATLRTAEGRMAQAMREPQGNLWTEVVARETKFGAVDDRAKASGSATGIMLGGDARVTPDSQVGMIFGYTKEKLSLDQAGSSTDITRLTTTVYGRVDWTPLFVEAVAGGSFAKHDSRRTIAIPGYTRVAEVKNDGRDAYSSLRAGYNFGRRGMNFTPYAGINYIH
ncbi:MAG: autotransporter-associated beta strand repeat-containing protein, partial [Verrucomicrobiota bacterium]